VTAIDYGTCNVCDKEPAVGVASSTLGPMSFAYGRECLKANAEPYGPLVTMVAMCGGRANLADWVPPIIEGSLRVAGKSMEDFDADVAQETAELQELGAL